MKHLCAILVVWQAMAWSGKLRQEVNAIRQDPDGTFRENSPSEVQQPHEHRYETKSNYRQVSGSGRFEPATNTNSQGNWRQWSWNRKGKATWARKNKGKASWARENTGKASWARQNKGNGQGKGKGRAWNKGKERKQQGKGKGRDWRKKYKKLRQEFQDHWIQEHNGSLQGWKEEWGKWRKDHKDVVSGKTRSEFSASNGAMKKLKQKFKKYYKQHKGSGSWQWAWRQVKNEKWTTSSRTPEWMEDWFKSTGGTGSNGNENETENGSETDANASKSSSSESDSESKSKSSKSSSGSKSKGKSHSSEHTSKESSESEDSGSSADSETSSTDTDGTDVEGLTQEGFRQIFRSMQGSDENWEEAWNLWLEEGGGSEETVQTWIKNLLSSNGGTENGNLEKLQDRFRAAYRHEHKNSDEGWETAWQAWLLERDGPGKDMNRWVERWVSTNGGTENQEKENRRTDVSSEEFRESYAELHHDSDKGWEAAWKDWLTRKTEPASLRGWIDEWISINEGEIHHKYSGGARHGSNSEGGTVQIISGGDFSEGQKSHGIDGYTGVLVDPRLVVDYGDGAELQQITSNTVNLAGGAKTHVSEHSGSSHENSGKVDVYTSNLGAEGHGGATIKGDGDRVTEQSSGLSGGVIDEGNEVQTEIGGVSKVNGGGGQTGEKTGVESQAKSAELEVLGSFVPKKTDATDKSEETTGIESSVDNHSGTETGFEIGGTRTGTHSSSLGGRVSGQLETTNNFGLGSSSGWATDRDSHSVGGSASAGENGGFEGGRRVDGQSQGSTGGGKGKQGGATWSWENRRWNEFGGKGNAGGEFGGSANVIVDHTLQTGSAESSERTGQAVKEVSTSSGENGGFEGGRRVDGQSQGSTGGGKGKQGGATWSWENRRWNEFGGKSNAGGEFGGSANVIVDHTLQTGSAESSERTGQAVKEVSTSSGENGGFEGGRRVDGQSQGSTGGGKGKQGGATWSWENRRWNEFGGKGNAGGEFGGSANVIVDHTLQTGSAESSERTGQAVKEVSTSSGENGGFEGGRRVDGQSQGSTGGGKGKQGGATWSWENRRWNEFGGKSNAGGEFGGSANVIVDHTLQTGSAESSERTGQAVKEVSTSSGENGGFEGGRRVDGQSQGSTGGGKGKQGGATWLWRNGRWIRVKHFGGKGSTGAQFEGSAEGRQDHKWKKESAESRGRTGQSRWSGGGSVSGSSSGRYEGEIEWPKRRRIPNGGKETFGEEKEFHKHKSGGSSSSGYNVGRYGVDAGLSLGSKGGQGTRPTFVGGKGNVYAGAGEGRWSAGGNVPVSAGQNYGWESEWSEGRNGKSKYKGGYNGGYESEISTGGWTYGEHGRLLGEGKFRGKSGALAVIKGQKCFIPHGHYHTEGGEIVIDRSSSEGGGSYSGASGYRIGSKGHEFGANGESGHEYKTGLGLKAGANGGVEGQYGSSASGNLNAENQSGGGSGHAVGASVNFGGLRASAGFGLGGKGSLGAKSGGSASTRHKYRWSGATRSSSLAEVGASGGNGCGSNDFMCKVTNAVKAFFS